MNLEHYRNFVQIVEIGTITGAARHLHIAQPALSNQIKALEKEYGGQLLHRGPRHVELTAAGEVLYEKAKLMCSLQEITENDIKACILGNKGILRIGLTQSYPDSFVEALLNKFSGLYPHIVYEIYEASSDEIMKMLKDSIIEVGLIRTPRYINPIFESFNAVNERLMAVFHKDNKWLPPDMAAVPIDRLKGVPLSISRGFQEMLLNVFDSAGITPAIFSICSSRPTNLMWAKHKKAVAIVTATSNKAIESDILQCRPLSGGDVLAKRTFTVLKAHKLSAVAQSFLDFATAEQKD